MMGIEACLIHPVQVLSRYALAFCLSSQWPWVDKGTSTDPWCVVV